MSLITGIPLQASPYEGGFVGSVDFTIGAEAANAINVVIQLNTGGNPLTSPGSVFAYLSDNADGSTLAASAPSSGWAIGTDGLLIPVVANKAAVFVSEADGLFDVTISESSAKTFYVAVILNGQLVVSGPVTFS